MKTRKYLPHIAAIAIVFGLVALLNALAAWHEADTPWVYLHSDHENLGAMYFARSLPGNFERDYFFQDSRYYGYYTPSFFTFVNLTAPLAQDFFHSIALLQGPILLAYLVAAYALFWQVTDSPAIGLAFALFSIVGTSVIIDLWRVTGFSHMLPRTLALPGLVFCAFLLMRFYSHRKSGLLNGDAMWHWLLLGLLVGANANLHPPTGIAFAGLIVVAVVAHHRWHRRPAVAGIALLVVGVIVGSLPIVLNVTGGANRGTAATSEDFQRYATAFEDRVYMLPQPDHHLLGFSDEQQYVIAYLWLPLTVISWLLIKPNQRSWASLTFVAVQLVYTWLLIANIDKLVDVLIVAVPAVFFVWRWWIKDEGREIVFYEMLAAIVGVSFFLVFFLRTIWLTFEVWQLTTLVAELARGARLLTLPIFLIGARFALHISREVRQDDVIWLILLGVLSILVPLSPWHGVLLFLLVFQQRIRIWRQTRLENSAIWVSAVTAVSLYMIAQIVTRLDPTIPAVLTGAAVGLAFFVLSRSGLSQAVTRLVIVAGGAAALAMLTALNVVSPIGILNDSPWYIYVLRGAPEFITFLVGSTSGVAGWLIFKPYLRKSVSEPLIWLSGSVVAVIAIQSVGFIQYSLKPLAPPPPAIVQAGFWAKANTSESALFLDTFDDGSRFRIWSQRSVTHGYKELGLVGYAQPLDMASQLERYRRIVAALDEPDDVLAMADELGVDYIIRDKDEPLDLPVVYENDDLVIYELLP